MAHTMREFRKDMTDAQFYNEGIEQVSAEFHFSTVIKRVSSVQRDPVCELDGRVFRLGQRVTEAGLRNTVNGAADSVL